MEAAIATNERLRRGLIVVGVIALIGALITGIGGNARSGIMIGVE